MPPLLFHGHKFDLRLYALLYNKKIYLFNKGLIRICSKPYLKPTTFPVDKKEALLSQLTNFSLNSRNKQSKIKTKRSLDELWKYLTQNNHDIEFIWDEIKRMTKNVLSCQDERLHESYKNSLPQDKNFESCFDIVGVDIMLNNLGRPFLLEVNRYPSLKLSLDVDEVKIDLIRDVLRILAQKSCVDTSFEEL